ncbi:MAG: extracellular solute-binding protein [Thermotogae bacterium]|nr:extracellular solute-binding protein [Thermotogota bacterium]MCP5465622.1 extracellular solute-binding protein [Thermotogota bacterium]HOO74779.1 extracellular solute-binding protein [Tepiditoga sp.]
MKKLLVVLLSLVVVSMSFAVTKVEFWHAMSGNLGSILEQLVKDFNVQNPDVEVVPVYVGNYSALNQKLLSTITAYAQGSKDELPVVAQAYSNWTAKYLFSDVVESLNSYINDDPEMKNVWKDKVYTVLKDMCMWGDTVYALPFNKSVYVYFYNTDLFDIYGIEPPQSMLDFLSVTNTLTDDFDADGETDQYGIGSRTTVDDFQTFLYAYDGNLLTYVGDGKYKIDFNETQVKDSLEIAKKLKDNGFALFQGGYLNDPFGNGQIAAYMGTVAGKNYVDSSSKGKHGWSWAPLPSVDGVPRSPIAGTDLIMFNWASQDVKDAAWRFMKYLVGKDQQAYWAIQSGYVPVRKDVVETEQWKKFVAQDARANIALTTLETAVADPKPAALNDIRYELGSIYTDFLNDKITLDETYNRMVKSMEELLDQTDELAK